MPNLNVRNAHREIAVIRELESKVIWAAQSLSKKDYSIMDQDSLDRFLNNTKAQMDTETETVLRITAPIRHSNELDNYLKPSQSRLEKQITREVEQTINDKL